MGAYGGPLDEGVSGASSFGEGGECGAESGIEALRERRREGLVNVFVGGDEGVGRGRDMRALKLELMNFKEVRKEKIESKMHPCKRRGLFVRDA
jgi:hypothetical protein